MDDSAQEVIGRGQVAEVLAHGPHVLKRYLYPGAKAEVLREAAILAALEPLGLPVPAVLEVVESAGRWGLVMTRAPGRAFAEAMMADASTIPAHVEAMVALQRRIHSQSPASLPSHKAKLAAALARAPLSEAVRQGLLQTLAALPSGDRLCHLDFHPGNIIGDPKSAMIVDWLDAAIGDPAADVCRSHVLMHPVSSELADAYLSAYTDSAGRDRAEVMRWRPVIAGARLAEKVSAFEPYLRSLLEE